MDNLTVWNDIMQDDKIPQGWKDIVNAGLVSGLTMEEILDAILEGYRLYKGLLSFAGEDIAFDN
jgi:hypothetical protein